MKTEVQQKKSTIKRPDGSATSTNQKIIEKVAELYSDLYEHDGFGSMSIDMKILKRKQKEIVLKCGCEYRYVVDWTPPDRKNIDLEQLNVSAQHVGAGPNVQRVKTCQMHADQEADCSAEAKNQIKGKQNEEEN